MINKDDWDYCKNKNLMPTQLLRGAIRDHRVHSGDPDTPQSSRELYKKLEIFQNHLEKMRDFMNERGILDEYLKDRFK